jgi:hypothetical protein
MVIYKCLLNKTINSKRFFIFVPRKGRFVPTKLLFEQLRWVSYDRPFLFTKINIMHIEEKYILEFKKLYKKVFKEDISYDEALKQCTAMVNLGKILYRPITKKDLEKYGN